MIFNSAVLQTSFQASIPFVRDTSTCNQTVNSNPIYVLDYRFQNEDSINDLWTINLDLFLSDNNYL
jgi:hypothetical protein